MSTRKKYGGGWKDVLENERGTTIDSEYLPWLRLAGAVLAQASRDYMVAIIANDTGNMQKFEAFFLSEYGQTLSFQQGDYIIRKTRENAAGLSALPRRNASRRRKG